MAKTGRPKADVTKDKIVCVRLSVEEYERLKQYAESSKKTVSQVMQENVSNLLENA